MSVRVDMLQEMTRGAHQSRSACCVGGFLARANTDNITHKDGILVGCLLYPAQRSSERKMKSALMRIVGFLAVGGL